MSVGFSSLTARQAAHLTHFSTLHSISPSGTSMFTARLCVFVIQRVEGEREREESRDERVSDGSLFVFL